MKYLSTIFGLVTKHDPTSENSGLFFAQYLTLKLILNQPITSYDKIIYMEKMYNARVEKGLYRRSAHHQIRTVSHDEITGMLVGAKILGTWHGNEIMRYLELNFGNYPATGENKFYQPSNYYMWGLLTDRIWTGIFFPLYLASMMISIGKDRQQTSSKLIYLVELYSVKDKTVYTKLLWKIFVKNMQAQYGEYWVKELFAIYFHTEDADHPLIELSRKVEWIGY